MHTASQKTLRTLAIALGSFLVFAMEPLVGRTLLAAFGGIASVWVTCLVAFQVLLVAGYAYAHFNFARPTRGRLAMHILLLIAAAAWCWFVARHGDAVMRIAGGADSIPPSVKTLVAVMLTAGIPFVLLSSNSSLVQVLAGGDYRLYAVGNAGSLLGLLAYPVFIEPRLSIDGQWMMLATGVVVYSALIAACAGMKTCIMSESTHSDFTVLSDNDPSKKASAHVRSAWLGTTSGRTLLWFLLSAASCFLLNGVTAHLTGNIAPIPLLWAGLLAVYLVSYIVGFSNWGAKLESLWAFLGLAGCVACTAVFRSEDGAQAVFARNLCAAGATLLFGATAIHARLYSMRPGAGQLTRYYLMIAVGGAAGGLASGLLCPAVATFIVEYPIGLAATLGVCLWVLRGGVARLGRYDAAFQRLAEKSGAFVFAFAALAVCLAFVMCVPERGLLARGRSFYGAWRVKKETVTNNLGRRFDIYEFFHDGTLHGLEPVDGPHRGEPTAYFGPDAGGLSFTMHPEYGFRGLRSGVIGLGIGVLACYAREQDTMDFFEICPEVIKVATGSRHFDFWSKRKGGGKVVCGDARSILERQRQDGAPKYDVLVVDAYSGDSIPYHLVTKEAFRLYADRIADGGILALHITNWNVDLFPIAKAAAKELGMEISVVAGSPGNFTTYSNWAFLSKRPLHIPENTPHLDMASVRDVELPSDRKGSLIGFLKWKFRK